MNIRSRQLIIWSMVYLCLPYLLFLCLYINIFLGIPASLILFFVVKNLIITFPDEVMEIAKWEFVGMVVIILLWVGLSGIGGFSFQNCDFNYRNAVLRDLITHPWPVIYDFPSNSSGIGEVRALVYYIGYWLPTALVGKVTNWVSAQIFLYGWTCFGIVFSAVLLKKVLREKAYIALLAFIFFSGMDYLGALIQVMHNRYSYPYLWPPVSHLEWWMLEYQFTSITAQLFWVFNQAVPSWILTLLIIGYRNRYYSFFLWGISLFFSPLAALGLLPFVIELYLPPMQSPLFPIRLKNKEIIDFFSQLLLHLKVAISVPNIVGTFIVVSFTFIYFSSNPSVSKVSLAITNPIQLLLFYLIEGWLLLILVYEDHKCDWRWYITLAVLAVSPVIKFGFSIDFSMRVTIPAIVFLFIMSMQTIRSGGRLQQSLAILLLLVGAITPLFEISRSFLRTFIYMDHPIVVENMPADSKDNKCYSEIAHPNTLIADEIGSFEDFDEIEVEHFIGDIKDSLFFDISTK